MGAGSRADPRAPRILVARSDHLGDVLLGLPATVALRRAMPSATISYLVAPESADAVERCPAIDEVLVVARPSLLVEPVPAAAPRPADVARIRGRFDLAILPRPFDPWFAPLVRRAEVPTRVGYDQPDGAPWLTDLSPLPGREHVVRSTASLFAAAATTDVDVERTHSGWIVPTAEDRTASAAALADGGPPDVVVHPTSAWPLKSWPTDRWRAVVRRLHRHGLRIGVVGRAQERTDLEAIADGDGVVVTPAGIGPLAVIHRAAMLVLGVDSGALHLAAAMGRSVVALFGPADPLVFAPWPPAAHTVVSTDIGCRPCHILRDPPCGARDDPACMTGIEVDDVVKSTLVAMSRVARGRTAATRRVER